MKKMFQVSIFIVVLGLVSSVIAAVPQMISHQGKIAVDGSSFTGTGSFKFALINSDGSETYWMNSADEDADGVPDNAVSLTVKDGLYSVLLGDTSITNMQAISYAVFENESVWLRIWFDDGTNGSQQLSRDQRIAAVGYAMQAAGLTGEVATDSSGNLTTSGTISSGDKVTVGSSIDGSSENMLDVAVSSKSTFYLNQQVNDNDKLYNTLNMNTRATSGDRNYIRLRHGGTLMAQIYSYALSDSKADLYLQTRVDADMKFETNGSNLRMIIKNDGKVGIGTDSPSTKLVVNGTITATDVVTTSDRRFKTNIVPIENALDIVKKLRGVYFNWKQDAYPDKAFSDKRKVGFIGQEVEAQIPELVKTDNKGYKAVAYQDMTAVLLEAVKSQQKLIEKQQELINKLEKKVSNLEQTVESNQTAK